MKQKTSKKKKLDKIRRGGGVGGGGMGRPSARSKLVPQVGSREFAGVRAATPCLMVRFMQVGGTIVVAKKKKRTKRKRKER